MLQPRRKKTIRGYLIEEYYWDGRLLTYVDHQLVDMNFGKICKLIKEGKWKEREEG